MTSLLERLNRLIFGEQRRKRQLIYAPRILPTESIPTDPAIVWGCDFSGQWDGLIDFFKYKSRGARFVVIKIADGTIKAKYAEENVRAAKSFGLIVGGYYWLYRNARISGRAQADAWWNISKDLGLDFHCIDFEWTYWLGRADNPDSSDLWGAAEPFRLLSGKYPFIYSARGYMDQYFNHAATWKPFPFWEAQYGVLAPDAVQPWGAHGHTLWQCASNWPGAELGVDPNWSKGEDGNIFNGSVTDFETMFATTEPPETGDTMTDYKIVWPNGAQERTGPAISAASVPGAIHPLNQIVQITQIQVNIIGVAEWGQLTNGNWIATIYNSQPRAVAVITPPPPPPPVDETTFTVRDVHKYTVTNDQTGEVWSAPEVITTSTLTKQ